MMIAYQFLKTWWKPLAVLLTLFFVCIAFVWTINAIYERGRSSGLNEARLECSSAREAAQRARDQQIEAIRAEEDARRQELQDRLQSIIDRNEELDIELAAANREAAQAERETSNAIEAALRDTGSAECAPTGSVLDEYASGLSTYSARHGH